MIEEVVSVDLAVHERLTVRKNRLAPKQLTGNEKRISIVTGTHGDELDGQYVCYEIVKQLNAHPEKLKGIVDIYPDVNPLGLDTGSRGIPMFDLDMNRVFREITMVRLRNIWLPGLLMILLEAICVWIFIPVIFLSKKCRRCV